MSNLHSLPSFKDGDDGFFEDMPDTIKITPVDNGFYIEVEDVDTVHREVYHDVDSLLLALREHLE